MSFTGVLRRVGRIKDMIIRRGGYIYPREIEEFLHGRPEVQDVWGSESPTSGTAKSFVPAPGCATALPWTRRRAAPTVATALPTRCRGTSVS
jgi:acyl-CoA synthetase (AMP-forming)/AMP-acid ligase II